MGARPFYVAERHVIVDRYREWEIIARRTGEAGHFNPWRPAESDFKPSPIYLSVSVCGRGDEGERMWWSLSVSVECELYRLLERQSTAFLPGAVAARHLNAARAAATCPS